MNDFIEVINCMHAINVHVCIIIIVTNFEEENRGKHVATAHFNWVGLNLITCKLLTLLMKFVVVADNQNSN